MASETASISLGIVLGNTSKKSGTASAQIVTGALEQPQPYSGGTGIQQSANAAKQQLQIPHISQFFGKVDSQGNVAVNRDWYRFLEGFFNKMGGPQGASIPDLTSTVVDTRSQAITAVNGVSAVSQQVDANAQTLAATVQVAQNNSLVGSTQIPPVVYSSRPGQMER